MVIFNDWIAYRAETDERRGRTANITSIEFIGLQDFGDIVRGRYHYHILTQDRLAGASYPRASDLN